MKRFIFLFALFFSSFVWAQTPADTTQPKSPWTTGGQIQGGFSQVAVSNWAGGGISSVSGNGTINLFANYDKGKYIWSNSILAGYGLIKEKHKAPVKTDDKLEINISLERKTANPHWTYGFNENFKTQFAPGYAEPELKNDLISDILSPAYNTFSFGANYKPGNGFEAHLAPIAHRMIIVQNQVLADSGAYGVDPAVFDATGNLITHGKNIRHEIGAYIRATYEKEVLKNVELKTKLELFSDYLEDAQNVDVFYELLLNMKINGYLSTAFALNMIYDDNVGLPVDFDADGNATRFGPRLQLKEVWSLALNYKF